MRSFSRPLLVCLCLLSAVPAAHSATLSGGVAGPGLVVMKYPQNGTFDSDDQVSGMGFGIGSPATVTLQTWSFAGGDSFSGALNPGGFSPVLSLFTNEGSLIAFDRGASVPNCGVRNIDPVSGFCLDSYINIALSAGSYRVILTQDDNTPNGDLETGFLRENGGNFTGPEFGVVGGSFILFDQSHRTSTWSFGILIVMTAAENVDLSFADVKVESTDPVSQTPEVSSGVLSSLGSALMIFTWRHSLKANHTPAVFGNSRCRQLL
jgi:hypothetical protein